MFTAASGQIADMPTRVALDCRNFWRVARLLPLPGQELQELAMRLSPILAVAAIGAMVSASPGASASPRLTASQERKVAAAPANVRDEYRRCLEGRNKATNRGTMAGAAGGAAVGVLTGQSIGEVALMSGVGAGAGNLAGRTKRCDQLVARYGG
jgi:outer membrane lipoprotein SlyB